MRSYRNSVEEDERTRGLRWLDLSQVLESFESFYELDGENVEFQNFTFDVRDFLKELEKQGNIKTEHSGTFRQPVGGRLYDMKVLINSQYWPEEGIYAF